MDKKPWYQSLTVWGVALITLSGLFLPLLGKPDLAETVQTEQGTILDLLARVGEIVGIALALYGRLRANTSISSL